MSSNKFREKTIDSAPDPIADLEVIERLRRQLLSKPRDLLLFDLVTQTGLKAKDLLPLKVKDLQGLEIGDRVPIHGKTASYGQTAFVNHTIHKTFQLYVEKTHPLEDEYLFKSRKGGKQLTITSVSHMVRKWFEAAGMDGPGGIRVLRRIWEIHFRSHSYSFSEPIIGKGPEQRFSPIAGSTLQDLVYEELLDAIVTGRVQPGERLLAERVAKEMNVSVIPVREAMARLRSTGLILAERRENIVLKLTQQQLHEITEIRLNVEAMIAERATAAGSDTALLLLEDLHKQFSKAISIHNLNEALNLNRRFHFTIYQEAKMPILQQIIISLWEKIYPYLYILVRGYEGALFDEEVIGIHQGILNGMAHRNAMEMRKWLRKDLLYGQALYEIALDRIAL